MDNSKYKMIECCRTNRCGAVGVILIVIATILTIVTFSGLGIFGMFLVGVAMCCHKRLMCQCPYCNKEVCNADVTCVEDAVDVVVVKEPRKHTKKV